MRLCYLLAYRAPDYIRTRNIVGALKQIPGLDLEVIINRNTGIGRYLEVLTAARRLEKTNPPDYYLIGFRGHELYPLLRTFVPGHRILFDCMMSPSVALLEERPESRLRRLLGRALFPLERWILRDCRRVLTDTPSHATMLTERFDLSEVPAALPVCAEEHFVAAPTAGRPRVVLFYGSFLRLHGVPVILAALRRTRATNVVYRFVGGTPADARSIAELARKCPQLQIEHIPRVPFDELMAHHLAKAWLTLGGPFGDTPQGNRVITGKAAQALAMGIPTVVGSNPETAALQDKHDCLLVPQGDPDALAEALEWADRHPDALADIGRNGQRYYHAHLGQQVVTAELARIIGELADARPDGSGRTVSEGVDR